MPGDRAEAIRALVAQWLRWAGSDLALAQMTDDERILPEILAFHAQQAAEKALKALLIHDQVEFPRTHAIAPLLNLCERAGHQAPEKLFDALVLTRYAVATRYPGEEDSLTRDEAREAALTAAQVLQWVQEQLENSLPIADPESQPEDGV
jgi:HEPN domain-containing protein